MLPGEDQPAGETGDDFVELLDDRDDLSAKAASPAPASATDPAAGPRSPVPRAHPVRCLLRRLWRGAGSALGILGLLILAAIPVGIGGAFLAAAAPVQVNSVAYLAGWGRTDIFVPVSHAEACDDSGGCKGRTSGYLASSHESVSWDSQVPVDMPFPVHAPVIVWGLGRYLISGAFEAVVFAVLALFAEAMGLAIMTVPWRVFREQW
jgi:hypothetical protein